jgi:hypothetical protein
MTKIRCGNFKEAELLVKDSLNIHFATGRLWAVSIQLQHSKSNTSEEFVSAHNIFIKALKEIPKSGEVWTEGARLAMNNHPQNQFFNLENALKYLQFAI